MSIKAYVLVNIAGKDPKYILEKLRASGVVQSADAVTGPYDIIASVHAEDMHSLAQIIAQGIHSMEGIERTLSCIVLEI